MIYGLLYLFASDPHIDKADAKQLIKEIAASIRKISEDRFVVISTTHCNLEYERTLFPVFDNVIRITTDTENSKVLNVNIHVQKRRIRGEGALTEISTEQCRPELSLVPSR